MFNNNYYVNNIGPVVSDEFYLNFVLDGYKKRAFRRMMALKEEDRKKFKKDEYEYQLNLAKKSRFKSDKEIITNHIFNKVRLDMAINYDYHEIMTHYFLGLDEKERPFDIDRYGIPYYLDLETLNYKYYKPSDFDDRVLKYSDAKRKRLGLQSLVKTPLKNWIYGETIDNSPYNMDNIFKDEIEIRSRLDQYKDTIAFKDQFFSKPNKNFDFECDY